VQHDLTANSALDFGPVGVCCRDRDVQPDQAVAGRLVSRAAIVVSRAAILVSRATIIEAARHNGLHAR
jgi:hypothetical protein